MRTDSTLLDINADWIDYAAAGVSDAAEMEARILEILKAVDLEEPIFEFGLRSAIDRQHAAELREPLLGARRAMHERLASLGMQEWVERFDPARYNRNASLAENLLFGAPVGKVFDVENLAKNEYVRKVLDETGLTAELLRIGQKLAETMVELFSGLPPGHEFFERFSFIRHEDLPVVKEILAKIAESGLDGIEEQDRDQILALPFKLVTTRHRLGLIEEALEARILEARRYFAANLPEKYRRAVEFFDPEQYNNAASLQDNILFGKVVTGQAEAPTRIGALLRTLLDELGLRPQVVRIGLEYHVGVAGARLAASERQKIAIVRAMLKRPAVLILDQAASVLDPSVQSRVLDNVLASRKGSAVFWVLQRNEHAQRFSHALVMERGKLAECGPVGELKARGGALTKLLQSTG